MIDRPLDLLNQYKGSKVLVHCKGDKIYSGKLLAFDIHINLVLDNMREVKEKNVTKNLGLSFVRGDSVNYISVGSKEK